MKNDFCGQVGYVATYCQDYSNIEGRIEITGEEFKEILEDNFNYLTTKIESVEDYNYKKKNICFQVFDKETNLRIMDNKYFICVLEASEIEKGMIIGIHDNSNFKAYLTKGIENEN